MRKIAIILLFISVSLLNAQEFGFGFGFDEEENAEGKSASSPSLTFGGEVSPSIAGYFNDSSDSIGMTSLGSINLSFKYSMIEAYAGFNFEASETPASVDEAYIGAYFSRFSIEAGLRKLTWGKADSMGPLDVINPLDTSRVYTEMADNTSLKGAKIPRPLVRATVRIGQFSKIEGVFIPVFKPHYIDMDGRWMPAQMGMLEMLKQPQQMAIPMAMPVTVNITPPEEIIELHDVNTSTIDYAQGGLRFTTTVGSADIGMQYYYGRITQPSFKISAGEPNVDMNNIAQNGIVVDIALNEMKFLYNPYHQIGFDYAQVLFGFNVRAELAANITYDFKGDDGAVYNPSIAWSLGFDRNLIWDINLNLQANESIRLMHSKLGVDPAEIISGNVGDITDMNIMNKIDIEGGSPITTTRITAALSKKFLRDELELRTAIAWGVEDSDCLIIPALIWTKDALRVALSAGIFAGDRDGQLGQYRDNNFLKASLKYVF